MKDAHEKSKTTTAKKPARRIGQHAVRTSRLAARAPKQLSVADRAKKVLGYLLWVFVAFFAAQVIVALIFALLDVMGVSFARISDSVLNFVVALLVYVVAVALVISGPRLFLKSKTTLADMGLSQTLPRWRDIGLAPVVYFVCLLASGIVVAVVSGLLPNLIDANQQQVIGFDTTVRRYELLAAYVTLTILAPIAEELLFRGYLFGKVRKHASLVVTLVSTAILFGALHLVAFTEAGVQWQWAVFIDTTILAIGLGLLREYTGSVWAGILVHAIKNTIAFVVLFILPMLDMDISQYLQ